MMIIDETYLIYGLLVSNSVLLAAATIATLRMQRLVRNSENFWDSPNGARIKDQETEAKLSLLVADRLSVIEDALGELIKTGSSNQFQVADNLPMENAVRMARHGATVEDITRSCGLSQSEARLLMRVHSGNGTEIAIN